MASQQPNKRMCCQNSARLILVYFSFFCGLLCLGCVFNQNPVMCVLHQCNRNIKPLSNSSVSVVCFTAVIKSFLLRINIHAHYNSSATLKSRTDNNNEFAQCSEKYQIFILGAIYYIQYTNTEKKIQNIYLFMSCSTKNFYLFIHLFILVFQHLFIFVFSYLLFYLCFIYFHIYFSICLYYYFCVYLFILSMHLLFPYLFIYAFIDTEVIFCPLQYIKAFT